MTRSCLVGPLLIAIGLLACTPYSETVGAAAPLGTIWRLETVNDTPSTAGMTIVFLANGDVRGQLPCNSYSARQTAPLPWFEVQDIQLTRRSCPEIDEEARLLLLFRLMDHAEVSGDSLLLSNPSEETLFFRSDQQAPAG